MADNLTQIHISATPPEGTFDDQQLSNVGVETPAVVVPTPSLPDVGTGIPTQAQVEVILSGFGEENIPDPRLFKFLPDIADVSDLFTKQLTKGLQDIYAASDYYTKLVDKAPEDIVVTSDVFDRVVTFNRVVDDGPYFAERYYAYSTDHYDYTVGPSVWDVVEYLLGKGFEDALVNTDSVAKLIEPGLRDQFGYSDVTSFLVAPNYLEVLALAERFSQLIDKAPQDQLAGLSDVVVLDPTKGVVETTTTSEQYVFNIEAEYRDQVAMTDDWLGAANIDDDEYAFVEKVLVDEVVNSDLFSRVVDYNRTYLETAAISEYFAQLFEQARLDSVANTDLNWFDVNTDYRETLALAERFAVVVEKPLNDQFSYSDLVTLQPTKGAADAVATSEQYAFGIEAVYEELLDATDDILGQANADDDEYADFTKVAQDFIAISEVFSGEYTKPLYETLANTDSVAQLVETPRYETVINADQVGKAVGVVVLDNQYSVDYYFLEGYVAALYATDVVDFTVGPGFADSFATSDYFDRVVDYKREPIETTTTADTWTSDFTRVVELQLNGLQERLIFVASVVKADIATTSETLDKVVEQPQSDQTSTSEQYMFAVVAEYSDQVTMTDDALGVANIDDDEYATIEKVVIDTLGLSDSFVTQIGFNRFPEDLLVLAEEVALEYAQTKLDATTTSDQASFVAAPEYRELLALVETVAKDYTTPQTDSIAQSDVAYLNPNKGLVETTTTSDLNYFGIQPGVADTATTSEVITNAVSTIYNDTVQSSDVASFAIEPGPVELVNTSETIAKLSEIVYSELGSISEQFEQTLDKPFSETANTSEYIEFAITFYRTYLELIGTSEQLVYSVGKGLVDQTTTTDQLASEVSAVQLDVTVTSDELMGSTLRILADQTYFLDDNFVQPDYFGAALVAKDEASFEVKPVAQDSLSIPADVYSLEILPGYVDQATTSEQLVFERTYNLSDIVYMSDDVLGAANIDDDEYAQVGKSLLELVSSSDYVTTQTTFLRSFDEVGSSSDQIVFGYDKSITEVSTTSEAIGMGVSTVLSDTSTTSETYSNSLNKGAADTATTSEYRWANNQSYLNSTYTAVGYVGTNYTI